MTEKLEKTKDIEFEEILPKLKVDLRLTRIMLISFGIVAGIVKFFFKVPFPFPALFIIFIWFLLYFFHEYQINKVKTLKGLYNVYFRYNVADLLFLTIIIHYLGGVEWIGVFFYTLTFVTAGLILPKKKTITLGFIASFFYFVLILLEYFGVLVHKPLFLLEPDLYRSPVYIGIQILVITVIFYFIVEATGTFSEMLKEKGKQLKKERERVMKAYQEEEEARKVLEIKVRARTRELEELAEKREEIIEERTKELQRKIKELEKFQKVAVGRELKMVEIKEEIKELKKELKK